MYPKNHVPVTLPQGTSNRLQPSLAALRMPCYVSAAVWLTLHPARNASN